MKESIWKKYVGEKREELEVFCNEYRQFLDNSKTERESVASSVEIAKRNGYKDLKELIKQNKRIKAGDKVYAVNMDKCLLLFSLGSEPMQNGMNIVGSHIDSPRLDLKANPIYENNELCLFDTHYYGGIKKYQWTAIPLAMHGVVFKTDGSKIDFVFGEDISDPVIGITDLLPHLDKVRDGKIKGEDLNILAGSIPCQDCEDSVKKKVKENVLRILKQKNIEEKDLFSAEIEVVPAGRARNFGLDNSMIMAYGQDDRVCAYASLRAMVEAENNKRSNLCILVDKEEIGSVGATAMNSKFFENTIAEIMNLAGDYSELNLRRCFANSSMISSDVTAGFDPNYPTPMNSETDAHLGYGISFNKYTGSGGKYDANDSNPEFIASVRKILEENDVEYQATEMGKVDVGGGGTIAYIMANYGMQVIDAGVPLLNMHAPWEISSKADVYEAYRAYKVFFEKYEK